MASGPSSKSRERAAQSASIEGRRRVLSLTGVSPTFLQITGHNPSPGLVDLVQWLLREAVCIAASIDDNFDRSDPKISERSKWKRHSTKTYKGVEETGGDVTIDVELLTKNYKCRVYDTAEEPEDLIPEPRTSFFSLLRKKKVRVAEPPTPPQLPTPPQSPKSSKPFQFRTEQWACRRSYHRDQKSAGTASWEEFYTYMKEEHVATEKGMTDTVMNAEAWASWSSAGDIPPDILDGIGLPGSQWSDITLSVVEMEHAIGAGLQNRVFPVLQMTCQNKPMNEIYVISAPIYNWASWVIPSIGTKLSERHSTVLGSYASVEVFRRVPFPGAPLPPLEPKSKPKPEPEQEPEPEPEQAPESATGAGAVRSEDESVQRPVSKGRLSRTARSIKQTLKWRLSTNVLYGNASDGLEDESPAAATNGAPGEGVVPAEARATAEPDVSATPAESAPAVPAPASAAAGAPAASTDAADVGANQNHGAQGAPPAEALSDEANDVPTHWIEWTMATASDARGVLPMALQRPFVPNKIAEDVPMFTKWMLKTRNDLPSTVPEEVSNEGQV